jgi:arabinofuranan 3-O-arabinosyltransferase
LEPADLPTSKVVTVARAFVAVAMPILQTEHHPFGDDFINFWPAANLAWHVRAAEVYNLAAFHAFEQSVVGPCFGGYLYNYPPVLLLLTAPLALIPYVPALFVWLATG